MARYGKTGKKKIQRKKPVFLGEFSSKIFDSQKRAKKQKGKRKTGVTKSRPFSTRK